MDARKIKQGWKKRRKRKRRRSSLVSGSWRKRGAVLLLLILGSAALAVGLGGGWKGYDGLRQPRDIPENHYDMRRVYSDGERLFYEDGQYTSVNGVDVSFYQQKIDWKSVKADGIDFAMIRLGYRGYADGQLNLDSYYEYNIEEAEKAGLETGVYFFSQAVTPEEAMEEARFVLRKIRGKKIDGPIGFDMEWIEGASRINHLSVEEKTAIADAFCQTIAEKGYEPVIYGNPTWLLKHIDLSYLTEYSVWLAHFSETTDYPYAYAIWQYTDSGEIDGIKGNVDLNVKFVKR